MTADHIDRAAEVLFRWNMRHGPYFAIGGGHVFDTDDPYKPIAQALADAGLLATPTHDAAVRAEALAGFEVSEEWRVVDMGGAASRISGTYPEREFVDGIREMRGGVVQRRKVAVTEWEPEP